MGARRAPVLQARDDEQNAPRRRRLPLRAGAASGPGGPALTLRRDLRQIIEQIRTIPYGRNVDRSPAGVLAEGRGTCSTKHALLLEQLGDRPELDVRLVHRIYRVDRKRAGELFGPRAAAVVPADGLVDVHTYATILLDGRRTNIDVTFPSGEPWDGRSDMTLACGEGIDVAADDDPWAQKAELVARHCDPAAREPFIAALADVS